MMIVDEIRNAESEEVVYLLLVSYIEAARSRGRLKYLPKRITHPLTSKDEVRSQYEVLMIELNAASKRLDDAACINIKEALIIFATASYRLQLLDGMWSPVNAGGAVAVSGAGFMNANSNSVTPT